MNYQTELMRSILTNPKAQEIIDYVSPIYGESYVALWIYQAMGVVLGEIYDIANEMRSETTPATSKHLLSEWEKHYALPVDDSLTIKQRQLRLAAKSSSRGPCNPKRLEDAISSALGGATVEITENVAKNTFLVNIRDVVYDITPAVAVLERMKPSHLIYRIQVATQMVAEADIKAAIALTHTETNIVEFKYTIAKLTLTLDKNGVLIGTPIPTVTTDGTLVYNPAPYVDGDGVLTT